ncbi:MAG: hypothetical protein ACHREM_08875 [Polyangiales bacterium]
MTSSPRIVRRWLRHTSAIALVFATTTPGLADDRAVCGGAYAEGQNLKDKGQLIAAREQLKLCARPTCKDFMVKDCIAWLEEVDRRQPSIVLAAETPRGEIVDVVRVVDGAGHTVSEGLTGHAILVDPGRYELTFEARDGHTAKTTIVVLEGQKNQVVKVIFVIEAPHVATTAETPSIDPTAKATTALPARDEGTHHGGSTTLAWIAGVGGVALAGVGTYVALTGSSEFQSPGDNHGVCDTTCQTKQTNAQSQVHLGWGMIGLGALAIGGGVVLFATSKPSDGAPPAPATTVRAGPAGIFLTGTF